MLTTRASPSLTLGLGKELSSAILLRYFVLVTENVTCYGEKKKKNKSRICYMTILLIVIAVMVIVKSVYHFLYQFLEKVMSTISGDREQKQGVGGGGSEMTFCHYQNDSAFRRAECDPVLCFQGFF